MTTFEMRAAMQRALLEAPLWCEADLARFIAENGRTPGIYGGSRWFVGYNGGWLPLPQRLQRRQDYDWAHFVDPARVKQFLENMESGWRIREVNDGPNGSYTREWERAGGEWREFTMDIDE